MEQWKSVYEHGPYRLQSTAYHSRMAGVSVEMDKSEKIYPNFADPDIYVSEDEVVPDTYDNDLQSTKDVVHNNVCDFGDSKKHIELDELGLTDDTKTSEDMLIGSEDHTPLYSSIFEEGRCPGLPRNGGDVLDYEWIYA